MEDSGIVRGKVTKTPSSMVKTANPADLELIVKSDGL